MNLFNRTQNGYVMVCLYVDNTLIMENNDSIFQASTLRLRSKFEMKDLDVASIILGIKISRTCDDIIFSRSH